MLGHEIARALTNKKCSFLETGHEVDCASRLESEKFFLSRKSVFENGAKKNAPNWIINCAGFTDVDACETEKKRAVSENVTAMKNLLHLSKKYGFRLLHFSSDYVFDGKKREPYTEADEPHPLNFYGKTKAKSETLSLQFGAVVIRTSSLFGKGKPTFVSKIIRALQTGKCVYAVDDEYTKPTGVRELAKAVLLCIETNIPDGIYHFAETPSVSRFAFAKEIVYLAKKAKLIQSDCKVLPCKKAEFKTLARRPQNAVLSCKKIERTLGIRIGTWKKSLRELLENAAK